MQLYELKRRAWGNVKCNGYALEYMTCFKSYAINVESIKFSITSIGNVMHYFQNIVYCRHYKALLCITMLIYTSLL